MDERHLRLGPRLRLTLSYYGPDVLDAADRLPWVRLYHGRPYVGWLRWQACLWRAQP